MAREVVCVKITDTKNVEENGINVAATKAWKVDPERANNTVALIAFKCFNVAQVFFGGTWVNTEEDRYMYTDYKVATIDDLHNLGIFNILFYNPEFIFEDGRNPVRYFEI